MTPQVRVTGVLLEHGRILLCQQHVTESSTRRWSLPGGTLEFGESIEHCLLREMKEETALTVKVGALLHVADRIQDGRHIVHVTVLVDRVAGELKSGTEPDSGYRGEIKIIAVNLDPTVPVEIKRRDRIAQMVILKVERAEREVVDSLPKSERGESGHGSTGRRPCKTALTRSRRPPNLRMKTRALRPLCQDE
jgi:ADP-ribose pyrophosphatase YjhB (NUDIX family)